MPAPQHAAAPVPARLGLWDAVSIIIGIVVGAGIYKTPSNVFHSVPNAWIGLAVWAVAGLLCLVGALCYAELASTYPRIGGDYVYLTRAYGPWVGFLFAWAELTVIITGSIGMMAYVFADYAARLWSMGPYTSVAYAAGAVAALSFLNVLGVVFGKGTQNLLTAAKVIGLAGILAVGFLSTPSASAPPATRPVTFTSLAAAFVPVFLTYGGWNDAAYIAAEVRDVRRNIPRALILGTAAVTALYLLVNGAYLWGLGFEGVRTSSAVAADLLDQRVGAWASHAIAVLVMVSALGAVNGLILTGSRLYAALGRDYGLFGWLGRWNPERGSPVASLITQAAVSLGLIAVVGTAAGRAGAGQLLRAVGLPEASWEGSDGFETLLRCTGPVFWFFFLLTGMSLFVLRWKDPGMERPFSVPLFPWVPLVFCVTCAYMLYGGIAYAGTLGCLGAGLLAVGLPLYFVSRRRPVPATPALPPATELA